MHKLDISDSLKHVSWFLKSNRITRGRRVEEHFGYREWHVPKLGGRRKQIQGSGGGLVWWECRVGVGSG